MSVHKIPSIEELRALLRYDADTGKLYWIERPRNMFTKEFLHRSWNTRRAGKEALTHVSDAGYKAGIILKKGCKAHRVAWAIYHGSWPALDIDHINCDKTDNRISNLRLASPSENKRNTKVYKNNKSGFKGVFWGKSAKSWVARIGVSGSQIHLGKFNSPEEAHAAYCKASKMYHGEFSRTE